ncbi:S-adenosyl-L-methionine dependent methyltransferase [Panus rudis PR-1116 ss-1]|nr:S-adenosyl-L-methionine dependent methyltransferase [Panus rudis PR-1116 ss-1]
MHPSARVYTKPSLFLYDFVVLRLSNTFAWRCSRTGVLEPLFVKHLGGQPHIPNDTSDVPHRGDDSGKRLRHLDVGVGTGHYLAVAARTGHLESIEKVTLLDLNPLTLAAAEKRLLDAGYKGEVETVEGDVLANWRAFPLRECETKFDSISLFYLFHCLPGPMKQKASRVLSSLKQILSEDGGVLYGATILGRHHAPHNILGRMLLTIYNRKGIFSNADDSKKSLVEVLKDHFEDVEVSVVGNVALFVARKPILRVHESPE